MTGTPEDAAARGTSPEQVAELITGYLADELALPADEIDVEATFSSLGLGSQAAATMVGWLGQRLGRDVPVATLWGAPTVNGLARAVLAAGEETGGSRAARAVPVGTDEPLAVVSLAARLPGADTVAGLWRLVLAGEDAVGAPPPGRFPEATGAPVPDAGYLTQRLDDFDHRFFHLTPREVAGLDPVQRLFLEVSWEALEASSLPRTGLAGSATGVYVGSIWNEHGATSRPGHHTMHTATGSSLAMVANRVSYLYDLRGPSVTLDSACSSSLVAVHLAAQALRLGEIDAAVVGGVNLLQSEATMADLTAFGGLAADGRSKAFGADADGFGRGEGAVALVLKRLADAERDGDHIWCLLHGTSVNNDGHTNGLTAPSPHAQRAVIQEAHTRGGTDPAHVRFVETHGTGTALGDPIEATALAEALGSRSGEPVRLGTLKANVGHLEGAAGVAGLAKAALVVHHGIVPPCVLPGETNPHIDLAALHLDLPGRPVELPAEEPVLAGVSSFGWGGTNAHAVLGRYDRPEPVRQPPPRARTTARRQDADGPLFVFSPYGGQWAGMGRDLLLHDPVFRAAVRECDRGAAPVLGVSLTELLTAGVDLEPHGVAVCQPAVYAVQVGLVRSLAARGVRPATVVGHSLGEIAGAVAVDALTPYEGGRVVAHYAAAQQRLVGRGGGMAVVALGREELRPYLADRPDVVMAGFGSSGSTNLSGPVEQLDELVAAVTGDGHRASRINVSLAAHGPAIDEVREHLVRALGRIEAFPPTLPMVSTLDGRVMDHGDFDAAYFATALREPVDFAGALAQPRVGEPQVVVELNAHPILTGALRDRFDEERVLSAYSRQGAATEQVAERCEAVPPPAREALLTLSAHTPAALARRCREVAEWWPEEETPATVAPALAGLATLPHRTSVVAAGRDDARAQLLARAGESDGADAYGGVSGSPKVAFVFPGQGGQWRGMGRDLYVHDPVFARHLRRCDRALREVCGVPVLDLLLEAEDDATFTDVVTAQPLLFAVQVALAQTLRTYGVRPHAVVGHSMGEAAAAHLAGALSLRDAAAVIGRRSRLMQQLTGCGAMLATELTLAQAEDLCAGSPAMSVAVSNSARSTVLSGAVDDIERTARDLTERGVFNKPVRVEVASHSPQMDPILPELVEALDDLAPVPSRLPIHSTVLGEVTDGSGMDAAYWADNLRAPVLFADATERLLADGHTCFVEISPHPVLAGALEETAAERHVRIVAPLRRAQPEWPALLGALGRLRDAGVEVDLEALNPPARTFPVPLPYPWQRVHAPVTGGGPGSGTDPVGARAQLPHDPSLAVHAGRLDPATWSLGDHVIGGRTVVPAAVFAATAAQVARPVVGAGPCIVRDLRLPASLEVAEAGSAFQTTVRDDGGGAAHVASYGQDGDTWVQVATAVVEAAGPQPDGPALDRPDGEDVTADELYARFAERGLAFGPQYRRIRTLRAGVGGASAVLDFDPRRADARLPVDPRLLDAALQVAAAPLMVGPEALAAGQSVLTTAVRAVSLLQPCGADPEVVACLVPGHSADTFLADVDVRGPDGAALRVRGLEIRLITVTAEAGEPSGTAAVRDRLAQLPPAERAAEMVALVGGVVGDVAGVPSAQVDAAEPFHSMGLNSIMGLELRNRLERLVGAPLSSTVVWNYPTVGELAEELAARLAPARAPGPSAPAAQVPAPRAATEERTVPSSPDEPADDLDELRRELAELEAMMGDL